MLIQTLLKVVIGPGVTSFGGSKDAGRDATYEGTASFPSAEHQWTGQWLFQVKYIDFEEQGGGTARSALKATFRREMAALLGNEGGEDSDLNALIRKRTRRRQIPDNYILITDIPLTADARDELAEIASTCGFKGSFASIDGREVCEFLDIHPEIRQSHPQLLGLADLETIINRDLYLRSQAYVEQWQPRLATYVLTAAHQKASALLRKSHFLVLDGPPEAGKTTIAAALGLTLAAVGYEIIDIRDSNDFFRVYTASKSQVFIADDAVGSISLDPARADNWSRDLPSAVRKLDKKHLLIWTARRYILEEALAESRLGDAVAEFPKAHEVLVEVGALSRTEKAEILYNHAKAANLSGVYKKLIRKKASDIVFHGNFTPERIRQLVEIVLKPSDDTAQPTVGWDEVERFLNNPSQRWSQAYRKLSPSEQALLAAMLDFDGPTPVVDLKSGYELRANDIGGRLAFDVCVTRLEHSFLRASTSFDGEHQLAVQHPSLRDLLLLELKHDSAARKRYFMLASPFGLSSVIHGIAFRGEKDQEVEHAVVPENEVELEVLLDRVGLVCRGVRTLKEWEQILTAADWLIPRRKMEKRRKGIVFGPRAGDAVFVAREIVQKLAPGELAIEEFARTDGGRILASILQGFATRQTFENGQRFREGDWTRLMTRFYDLSCYLATPLVPCFTSHLIEKANVPSISSITLVNVIARFEPMVMRQKISKKAAEGWEQILESTLVELIEVGAQFEEGEDPQDFDEWHSDAEACIAAASEFCSWRQIEEIEGTRALQRLYDTVEAPEQHNQDDEEYSWPRGQEDYWTVERIFEDL